MIDIKFEGNTDVSKLEVGKEYTIKLNENEKELTIHKALIKDINIENNSATIEPLVEKKEETNQVDFISDSFSVKLVDKETGKALIDC